MTDREEIRKIIKGSDLCDAALCDCGLPEDVEDLANAILDWHTRKLKEKAVGMVKKCIYCVNGSFHGMPCLACKGQGFVLKEGE